MLVFLPVDCHRSACDGVLHPGTSGTDDRHQPHCLTSANHPAGDLSTNGRSAHRRSTDCHTHAGVAHHCTNGGANRHADDRADERPNLNADDRPNGGTDYSPNARGNLCSHGGSAYGLIFRRIVG